MLVLVGRLEYVGVGGEAGVCWCWWGGWGMLVLVGRLGYVGVSE